MKCDRCGEQIPHVRYSRKYAKTTIKTVNRTDPKCDNKGMRYEAKLTLCPKCSDEIMPKLFAVINGGE